jgi:hypothetical protein
MIAMFGRKRTAWYWKVLMILVVLRIIYSFAKFFMRVADKHASAGKVDR